MPELRFDTNELKKFKLFIGTPMFGGMCSGLFARSTADLSALCTNYGIQLQLYYLFNESLITRARNYICDEFMRSQSTHLMFIDADIGFDARDIVALLILSAQNPEYHIIGGAYPKKCLPWRTRVLTEDGFIPIGKLVSSGYDRKVKSLKFDGSFTWNKVTNRWSTPNTGKKWVGLQTSIERIRNQLICTSDHEVASVNDIMNPKVDYIQAQDMKGKYLVRNPNETKKNRLNRLYNKEQLEVFIGTILGDGHITVDGASSSCHGPKQKAYEEYKNSILQVWNNAQTKYLRGVIYPEGIKTLKNVVNLLDEKSLAFLYMDDGNRRNYTSEETEISNLTWWTNGNETKRQAEYPGERWFRGRTLEKGSTCTIATHCFTYDDVLLLQKTLEEKWKINTKIHGEHKQESPCNSYLYFDLDNAKKFYKLIAPYIHESMKYKLDEEFRDIESIQINNKLLDFACSKIVNIVDVNESSNLYDIEVENDHNFVTTGGVVHNCIAWEKVKQAVDKGFADPPKGTAHDLEKYIGDYVFNPRGGTQQIKINEPAEVLEVGTGFMMIRRDTMQKFQDAFFEQYKYKPDHIRTEHFDGSRYIMQFFQAEIDKKSERYLSEDYWFTQKAHEIQLRTWLCPWMKLQHMGSFVFGGSLADLAAAGSSATADADLLNKEKKDKKK